MPHDVTWQSTGPLPQCWFASHELLHLLSLSLIPCLCSNLHQHRALFSKSRHSSKQHTRLRRCSEWMGFNSHYLDGLPKQFFQIHFTYTTDAIKDPQRNISIEECLCFSLIVHLLWQTSKRKISALLNSVAGDV